MCIIIDTNCFANLFKTNSEKHSEFKPVLDWILKGNGKAVYGGSKYRDELSKAHSYLKIFGLLNRYNRTLKIDDVIVDKEQARIESLITDPDFDDPHLPAIVIASSCRLICSEDIRSIRFVRDTKLYSKPLRAPKYYTGKRNKGLLSDKNIPDVHKPVSRCKKEDSDILYKQLNSK